MEKKAQKIRRQAADRKKWRKLDNTAKLFAMVAGEDLSNVFRVSATFRESIKPALLRQALDETLVEFDSFSVKLRRGFFWNYFEVNDKEPLIEEESTYPCKYIDPHGNHLYLFRVSYFKNRINFEVFHALTDGMGAVRFLKRLSERYLELNQADGEETEQRDQGSGITASEIIDLPEAGEKKAAAAQHINFRKSREDGYLKHYKERSYRRYPNASSLQISGEALPLDSQSVVHGYVNLGELKNLSKGHGVSITKYLTAILIWCLIRVYGEGEELKKPVAINLPINLRSFFDSETMANFFAVTNISWPAGRKPEGFEEVLDEISRQMDEQIEKERLEETISYNVSREKKWYVRIAPLFLKNLLMGIVFMRSSRSYTMTLSNLGPVKIKQELEDRIRDFQLIVGVSRRQKLKCGVIAFRDQLCITFNSVLNDTRLSDEFFRFLNAEGITAKLESNGAVDHEHDMGTYPAIGYDRARMRKLVNLFYLLLFTAAIVVGVVNMATYDSVNYWWSVIAIGGIAYVAFTVRYSIMRRASIAGILLAQSLGAQILLVLIDGMTGFHRWSFNYAIPSVILFNVIAVICLILVNRLNFQSYFLYQIAITVFSFIPLILWAAGWVTKPLMAVITAVLSVAVMLVTILLGDRSVKNELKRRFHL